MVVVVIGVDVVGVCVSCSWLCVVVVCDRVWACCCCGGGWCLCLLFLFASVVVCCLWLLVVCCCLSFGVVVAVVAVSVVCVSWCLYPLVLLLLLAF